MLTMIVLAVVTLPGCNHVSRLQAHEPGDGLSDHLWILECLKKPKKEVVQEFQNHGFVLKPTGLHQAKSEIPGRYPGYVKLVGDPVSYIGFVSAEDFTSMVDSFRSASKQIDESNGYLLTLSEKKKSFVFTTSKHKTGIHTIPILAIEGEPRTGPRPDQKVIVSLFESDLSKLRTTLGAVVRVDESEQRHLFTFNPKWDGIESVRCYLSPTSGLCESIVIDLNPGVAKDGHEVAKTLGCSMLWGKSTTSNGKKTVPFKLGELSGHLFVDGKYSSVTIGDIK